MKEGGEKTGYARWVSFALVVFISLMAASCGSSAKPDRRDVDPRGASLLGEAQQAYRSRSYATTIQLIDSAATYVPELPDLWFLHGLVLSDLYRFDASDAAFEKALSFDPDYRSARYNMGHNAFHQSSYFAKNAYRDALRHYRAEEALLHRALMDGTARPGDRDALASVLLQIGTTYASLQLPDSASRAYRRALEVDSSLARGYAWLSGLQQTAGDLKAALANARRAVEIEPADPEHRLLLGVLLSEEGRYVEALPHLAEASRREPWNRTAIYNLGQALVGSGHIEDGEAYLARADTLEILRSEIEKSHVHVFQNPQDPIRWENYAYLLQRAGRTAEAKAAIGVMYALTSTDTSPR